MTAVSVKETLGRFHVVQRAGLKTSTALLMRLAAILLALITAGLFVWALGVNPFSMYKTLIEGSLGTATAIKTTAKIAIPLCITALGLTLAFKMKFWNIGGEGQIAIGAIGASFFAYTFPDWPSEALIPCMIVSAILLAGLWGLIPAYFKTRFGTNETLFTLMMNYIVVFFIQFLREGPWIDPGKNGFPQMARFSKTARLPMVLGVHIGWIFALALVVLVFVYLRYTKQGYELSVVGENINTAEYAGMPVKKIIMRTMFISAAVCGLAGMLQVAGSDKMLTDNVAGGVGFDAIIIAWLGHLSPIVILIVSILFGVLDKGCLTCESTFGLSSDVVSVFQGIILFFVLGAEFFINYRIVRQHRAVVAKEAK